MAKLDLDSAGRGRRRSSTWIRPAEGAGAALGLGPFGGCRYADVTVIGLSSRRGMPSHAKSPRDPLAGRSVDVRLIGVDTPETVAPGRPVECGGPQASAFTESELEGRRVEFEFDVQRIDPYGRTLAYVWLDGRLFNQVLVARGFARVATYPPDVKYVDVFLAAERRARAADRGLWFSS